MPAGDINDTNWHDVDIQVLDNKIYVRWDGQLILSYTDVYNRDLLDYQDFGFGSRSGGNVDNHYVRGLLVTKLGQNTSLYNVDGASPLASDLYWDNGATSLGVDTSTPHYNLEVDGTGAIQPTVAGVYNTGTACQSTSGTSCGTTAGTLVFGTGTTWSTYVNAGDSITFSDGESARITTVNSNTELTVSATQLIPAGSTYSINQGTACQSSSATSCTTTAGTHIFGTNTLFTAAMVGDTINWPDGTTATISAYTSATELTVSSSQLQAGSVYTIEAGGLQVTSTATSSVANVIVGANTTFGGTLINDTETATGTHTYNTRGVEQNAAYGYNFYTDLTSTTATTDIFNITGLPTTEGTTAFIMSELTAAGTNTQSITVEIGGTTMSTISKATAGTFYDDYIVMYSGSAWRIIGQGALTGQTVPTGYTQGADFAEWIPYSGSSEPQPGDVLTLGSSSTTVTTSSTPYDPALLGVVSTQPYDVAGTNDGHSVIIALSGRVPVNVSLANGPIVAGDPLTSSSVPGVAMKATGPGDIIGTALQSYDGTSSSNQIMVQLHVGYDNPSAQNGQIQGDQNITGNLAVSGNASTSNLTVANALNVNGNLLVAGTTSLNNLVSQSASINGQLSAGDTTLASLLIDNDLNVNGNVAINGTATIASLNVSGLSSTQDLSVNGTTSLAGDVVLSGKVNTRQAIIRTFTASQPITAGSVVVLDNSAGNAGNVTTTTTADDTSVIGVAVSAAAAPGDPIQVAIGGWVQV
ncbi:MAG: beta strand repeat-containing protein, partial [Candidatus Saccharimonadales bacterium]